MTIALRLPILRPDQWKIIQHPAREKFLAMGRRWGKTTLGGAVVLGVLSQHGKAAWVVPEYKNGRSLWRYVQNVCAPLAQAKLLDISKSERVVSTSRGGFLGIYSADNIDAIRNEWFNVVVTDEASRVTEEARTDAIMPTLADAEGDQIDIGTPKGLNDFYKNWQAARQKQNEDAAAFNAPTSANPMPSIQATFERVKRLTEQKRYPLRSFKQEWLAQFVSDGAGVFRNVRELSTLLPVEPIEGHRYIIGRDWGRTNDPSVSSVWDLLTKQEVKLEVEQDMPFAIQLARLKALAEKYGDGLVVAEQNSLGDPLIEQAAMAGIRIMPFVTTNATKATAVDTLALACERSKLPMFQADEQGILQMEAFESSRTPTGLVKYAAPAGQHDDICMARLFAYSAIAEARPVFLGSDE